MPLWRTSWLGAAAFACIGLIRIAGFAHTDAIAAFRGALEQLRGSKGLILDVRRNGGGDTAATRPVMGRFISARAPYAQMRRREGRGLGPAWREYVEPRGPFTCQGRVVLTIDLPKSGLSAQSSSEPVYDVGGQPRWGLSP